MARLQISKRYTSNGCRRSHKVPQIPPLISRKISKPIDKKPKHHLRSRQSAQNRRGRSKNSRVHPCPDKVVSRKEARMPERQAVLEHCKVRRPRTGLPRQFRHPRCFHRQTQESLRVLSTDQNRGAATRQVLSTDQNRGAATRQ